jgi:predicted permease
MPLWRWRYTIPLWLRALFQRDRLDKELDEELHDHIYRQIENNLTRGMSLEEARQAAVKAFGNTALLKESTRATWSWSQLEQLMHDLWVGLRSLMRTPGFAITAVLIMAIGIGANVTLFTVVHGIVLKPLPFTDPARLLMLYESKLHDSDAPGNNLVAGGIYREWKKQNHTFSSLALVRESRVLLSGTSGQLPEKVRSAEFSWDLLPTLGVKPAFGRNFTRSDDSPSGAGTVLLSWPIWQSRFGGDPGIENRTIYIDAMPYTVIGVMPSWFEFPGTSNQLFLPIYHERPEEQMNSFNNHLLSVVGRLKPGVSESQAVADLSLVSRHVHNDNPSDPFIYLGASSRTLLDHLVGDMKTPLFLLLDATGCVLLIACLNVANLLVARAAARRKDLAIRTALGGGWFRALRERLIESMLLTTLGGALGLVFAQCALRWFAYTRSDLNRIDNIDFDASAAAFTIGVVALCAAISCLISLVGSRQKTILATLHESSRSMSGERSRTRLRRVLLSVEVSLTVVLLVGAGLLLKSYERLRSSEMGCVTENVLTIHIGIPDARYGTPAQVASFYDALLTRLRALPGVSEAGFVDTLPGQGRGREESFTISEHPPLPRGRGVSALERTADATYFEAMGIPIVRGRTVNPSRRLKDANETVVDQSFVDTFLPGEEPIGKHLQRKSGRFVIVGVVGSTRFDLGENPRPMMYTSLESGSRTVGTIIIRSNQDVGQFGLPIQRIVAGMDPDLAVSDVLTIEQMLGKSTLGSSFSATMLAAFAILSLLLAAAGLFGVLSYIAAQRTREVGIRMALGARRGHVLWQLLMEGMGPAIAGLVFGLLVSLAVGRLLGDMLYKTQALDPAVFLAVALTLLVVGIAACVLPAWRASRLDPMQVLRTE